jgi:hypothetical protein
MQFAVQVVQMLADDVLVAVGGPVSTITQWSMIEFTESRQRRITGASVRGMPLLSKFKQWSQTEG